MKTYTLEKTNSKKLFRVVDTNGNWTHYYHKPTDEYLRAVNYILKTGFTKGERFEEHLKNGEKAELERKLKLAGERGDRIHDMISYILTNKGKADMQTPVFNEETLQQELLNMDEWKCILAFQEFWNRHEPILIDYEFPTWNLNHGFAGTGDALLILTKKCDDKYCKCNKLIGKIGLYDWKSGRGIWEDQGPQTSAYSKGENLDHPVDYTAILRLGTRTRRGYEFEPYNKKQTEIHWKEFLAAIQISDATYRPFDSKKIYDIPEKVNIKIKRFKKVSKKPKKKVSKKSKKRKVIKKPKKKSKTKKICKKKSKKSQV